MRTSVLILAVAGSALSLGAVVNNEIVIPDIAGYHTLKGDMHLHTVFSDGRVWPTTRVDEALWEGLDFITITDHVDTRLQNQVKAGYLNPEKADRNASYEIAKKYAGKRLIVIPGGEISRGMPPGHFNAFFVKDANAICKEAEKFDSDHMKAMEAGLSEAGRQGAFMQWNHPNWEKQAPDSVKIWPGHEKIRKDGNMHGIEIFNQFSGYCPEAHRYALDNGLTMTAGSDAHYPFFQIVDYKNGKHRPLTLVFAREKTPEGIREALDRHRTAVVADETVYGDGVNLRSLFDAMVTVSDVKYTGRRITFTITNNSTVPVRFKKTKGDGKYYYSPDFVLGPFERKTISVNPRLVNNRPGRITDETAEVGYSIENFITAPDTPLKIKWIFSSADLPETIFSGYHGKHHVQGIVVDEAEKCVYFSFTTKIIKTDFSGKLIGSVEGFTGHLGCLTRNPADGRIYGSIEYKNDAIGVGIAGESAKNRPSAFYIAIFDGSKITGPGMKAEDDGVMSTVYLGDVVSDYYGTAVNGGKTVEHRYGCSGIDGVSFAPPPGKPKSAPVLYVAYGIYGDLGRTDNDYQVLLTYNTSDWGKYEKVLDQDNPHKSGPAKPLERYFVFTGNMEWGIQNLNYNPEINALIAAVYKGKKEKYPNYSVFAIDLDRPAKKENLRGFDKKTPALVLPLKKTGMYDAASGVYGWRFPYGTTGICYLRDGLYYISRNASKPEQSSTLNLWRWTADPSGPFEKVKTSLK